MKKYLDYLPDIIKNLEQIKQIANIEDKVLESERKTIEGIILDQWIETATERGIKRREKILNIYPYENSTLEQRRTRVLALWFSYIPYTYRTLLMILDMLCEIGMYTVELYPNIYLIKLSSKMTERNVSKDIINLVHKMIPANLVFEYNMNFEIKDLKFYVGVDLSTGSHDIIECEEIN